MSITLESILIPNPEVATQEIEGEFIIIPLSPGIGDRTGKIFSLNETGVEIWKRLDGKRSLTMISAELVEEYTAARNVIEGDVLEMVKELVRRKLLVETKSARGRS
jgi:hypothetical protein